MPVANTGHSVRSLVFEVCANSLQSAINAQIGGANRIELCEYLEVGGISPAEILIREAKELLHLPIHVLVRPREGNFVYDDDEFAFMKEEIVRCKQIAVAGVVFGILNHNLTIHEARCGELIKLARPLAVTFHRAFDVVANPFRALDVLIKLGFDRVLTSGQEKDALKGSTLIHQLQQQAKGNIAVMAGGGITEENIGEIVRKTGAHEFHFSARKLTVDNTYVSDLVRIKDIMFAATVAHGEMH